MGSTRTPLESMRLQINGGLFIFIFSVSLQQARPLCAYVNFVAGRYIPIGFLFLVFKLHKCLSSTISFFSFERVKRNTPTSEFVFMTMRPIIGR